MPLVVQFLLKLLNSESSIFRSKVVRALAGVVSADPTLLGRQDVRGAVNQRITDTSISVREAVLDLVS